MTSKPIGIRICVTVFAILGVFYILLGAVMFLVGDLIVEMLLKFDADATIKAEVLNTIGIGVLAIGALYFLVTYGIWNLKKWARISGIMLAILSLLNIPVGTIIGMVILYFLLINDETKNLFR